MLIYCRPGTSPNALRVNSAGKTWNRPMRLTLPLSPFAGEETEAHLVWPKLIPCIGFHLEFETRKSGPIVSDSDHYNTNNIKIIIMIKSKLCVKVIDKVKMRVMHPSDLGDRIQGVAQEMS